MRQPPSRPSDAPWSTKRFTAAALVAIPLLVMLTSALIASQFAQHGDLRERVRHSYDTRFAILGTLSTLQDLETGQRGYLLTGNEAFLAPYRDARRRLDAMIRRLNERLARELEREVEAVEDLARRKLAFAERTIRLHTAGRRDEAVRLVATGEGKRIMDEIRIRLAAIDRHEQADLADAIARTDAARRDLQRLTYAIQLALLLLIAGAAIMIARSLSAQRRALQTQEDMAARQTAIFNSASDAMITHDRNGIIEALNPAATRLFGYPEGELVGQSISLLFESPPDPQLLRDFLDDLVRNPEGGASKVQRFGARRKDGRVFPVETVTSLVRIKGHELFLEVIRDVTERERVEQMKTEFVAVVSHELRTPLTSIAGSLGLLAGGAAGTLPERADRLIRIAHSNSERLVRLINDILDVEKIESGKMTFDVRPVPLRPLLEQAIQANRAYGEEFGVRFELLDGEEAVVSADPDRLMQVFTNLFSNAAKFSPRGETVEVAIGRRDGAWRTTVSDRGPGIPKEFHEHVFSKFAQVDSSDTRAKGGSGLGLSIVREIVTRLGGEVGFTSEEGVGTTFFVDLPAVEIGGTETERALLVLLCDEADEGANQVRAALERAGFRCDIATSAAELTSLTEQKDYSVLILDLPLPSEEMIGLIRTLRATERYACTPILVVATAAERGEVSQVLDVADCMEKPVAVERLAESVRAVLGEAASLPRILHVDDDLDVLRVVASAFEGRARLRSAAGLEEARRALRSEDFDLVILDLALPGGSGLDLLPDMRNARGQPVPVVIFSAHESEPDLARRVEATLTKSRASLDDLVGTVELLVARARRNRRQKEEE